MSAGSGAGGDAVSVSVIVPVSDRIDYLVEALQSIERQTSPPEEIVVVMDGSTVDVSAALAATSARARVVRRPRGGPGAARNTGCAAATGTLFAFLDSDDLWRPEKLERQLDALRVDPGLDFVFTAKDVVFGELLDWCGRAADLGLRWATLDTVLVRRRAAGATVVDRAEGAG